MKATGQHGKQRKPRTKPPAPDLERLRNAEFVSVPHFSLLEPAFSAGSLRWLLFHRETNGLVESGAVVQSGRRVLIRPTRFREWLTSRAA